MGRPKKLGPDRRKLILPGKSGVADAGRIDQLRTEYQALRRLQAELEQSQQVWRADVEVVTVDTFWREFLHRAEPSERQWEFLHAMCGVEDRAWPTEYQEIWGEVGQKGGKN